MSLCAPNNLTSSIFADACFYVRNSSECTLDSGFLNYYEWQYCAFNSRGAPTFLMLFWLLVLLAAIAITADSFFAPCLVVVTNILRLSQNLAGVTLLALGNGAPDLFSALSAVDSGNVGMAIGSIFGAGIMVNTITAGIIMIVCPFTVCRRPVLKDLVFYLIGILWCLVMVLRRKVELWSSLVLLSIYVTYVFVTALSRFLHIKLKKDPISGNVLDTTSVERVKQFDSVIILSKADIEEVQASRSGEINPSFLADTETSSNNLQIFRQLITSASTNTLSFRSSGKNITLNKVSSTSHRYTGFLAQLIIANEFELQSSIQDNEKESIMEFRRTQSLVLPPRVRHKRNSIMSVVVEERGSPLENNNTSSKKRSKEHELNMVCIDNGNHITSSADNAGLTLTTVQNASINSTSKNAVEGFYAEFPGMIKHFLLTIAPIDIENWKEQSILEKVHAIIQSPIVFILTLTIPVVDDGAFMRGWCKILNVMHCIISPMIWIIIVKAATITIGFENFYLSYVVLAIVLCLSIIVWVTSKADKPPIYHSFYAFIGFLTSIVWIYEIANEIVNILTVFGVVFAIPDTVLGLSVLAFANSIGDLVSNIALAKRNYPAIGYAACIGGPLFNLLVGIGLPFTIRTARKGTINIDLKSETVVLIFTAMLVTVMNLFALPIQRFRVRPTYGVILISLYSIFIVLVILCTLNIIKIKF